LSESTRIKPALTGESERFFPADTHFRDALDFAAKFLDVGSDRL
jgi:hypothetical protein